MKRRSSTPRLRLSPSVTFHARGEACFAWHGDTGDVCEMSRDVVALMIAFAGASGASAEHVCGKPPGEMSPEQAARFVEVLGERAFLRPVEKPIDLGGRRPFVSRFTVYESHGADAIIHGRDESVSLPGGAALLEAAAEGKQTLGELVPRARFAEVARLCCADLAALKLLPPGRDIPRWAESTMPWPAVDGAALARGGEGLRDPSALGDYHQEIGDAELQFDEIETTLSHLFRAPHPALGGERFGDRLAKALVARGVPARGARVIETGGGLGWIGAALSERLAPSSYLIVDRSPALARAQQRRGLRSVVGDAVRLPIADGVIDLLVSNEMAGDLPGEGADAGALVLVDECARVLAPGGVGYISEFGHPTAPPVLSDHLDHDERSIRFEDLRARAVARGLHASIVPVPTLIGLDPEPAALATTRASFAALRRLLATRGVALEKRAWLMDDIENLIRRAALDPAALHGLVTAPIGERTMGLKPREFWALIVRRTRGETAPSSPSEAGRNARAPS